MATREVLIGLFDAANRRDLDAAADFVDPAFVGEVPSDMSVEPDVYEGQDGLRRYLQSFWELVDSLTLDPEVFDEVGPWTVVSIHVHSIGRGSRFPVEGYIAVSARSRDDRLVRLRAHPDADAARAWARAAS